MIANGFKISRIQGFWHGIAESLGFQQESYTKELWTSELHHVFALKVHVCYDTFHFSFCFMLTGQSCDWSRSIFTFTRFSLSISHETGLADRCR